jgi:hypothetical protein
VVWKTEGHPPTKTRRMGMLNPKKNCFFFVIILWFASRLWLASASKCGWLGYLKKKNSELLNWLSEKEK